MPDHKAIGTWRSDTFRALTATEDYQNELHQRCIDTATYIMEYLQEFSFSKDVDWDKMRQKIMDQVLKPAATLGTSLVCSPEEYSWSYSFPEHYRARVADVQDFEFIDCNTHCPASKVNTRGIQDHSRFGHYIAPIFPGLCREAEEHTVTIQKPFLLVEFKDRPPKSNSISKTFRSLGR